MKSIVKNSKTLLWKYNQVNEFLKKKQTNWNVFQKEEVTAIIMYLLHSKGISCDFICKAFR